MHNVTALVIKQLPLRKGNIEGFVEIAMESILKGIFYYLW